MSEEEMLEQLYSLIDDRNTFILEDESNDCEIFKKDLLALETIIKSYNHDKICLSGYRESILRQCDRSQTQLQVVEDILLQNDKLKKELSKKEKIIDKILSIGFFENDCPNSLSGEELDCCEECKDDYKSCWLKYIEKKLEKKYE